MSTALPRPEPPLAGGQAGSCSCSCCRSSSSSSACPSAASVDVSKETRVSFWAAGLPDNSGEGQPGDPFCDLDFAGQDDVWPGDQLSSQLYRNKQLQDTLLQKEEELARLHEENNNLRQYLNSALIKCLEEKAKKLLSGSGQRDHAIFRGGKRKVRENDCFAPPESPPLAKARRNLFSEFTACEEPPRPAVDSWVLQTLGLKDIDTIDESVSANYSALAGELGEDPYCPQPVEAMDYDSAEDPTALYGCEPLTRIPSTASLCKEVTPYLTPLSSAPCASSSGHGDVPFPAYGLPYFSQDVSRNKTEVAFTTSVSPHRNVKTHTFQQGQAFVRRDDDGGWKFTWVPKQSE
ncbi:geminin coiled-coil domain-containing protein 1 [Alligator sinensis]|uniref:Geminin coiled-coil domain-containing protein 1 n=1 Tax=Alligator sinensis TaxID=38654 RepID=A0A3Q0HAR0_ALLSI|nr:geminin coiled-coil domain-containing protein 1 [Alligator sinensis]